MRFLMKNKRIELIKYAQTAILLIASWALILSTPLSLAQGNLPQLGDFEDMSLAAELKLGQRIARDIYRDPDYLDDPLIGDYVQRIWQPLLAAARARGEITPEQDARFAWQVMLARDRTINAFALPGAYLGVHLGLIALVASRDELASVLAHELSHVTQRHIARMTTKQNQQAPWILGAMILGTLAARNNPEAANAAIVGSQAVSAQAQLNFSRDMEREADRIGYQILQDAGFAVQGFVSMFDKLQQANRINDNGSFPYLRSHPLTSERIGDMQARMQLSPNATQTSKSNLAAQAAEHAIISTRARLLADPAVDVLRAQLKQAQELSSQTVMTTPTLAAVSLSARPIGILYGGTLAALRLRELDTAQQLAQRLANVLSGYEKAHETQAEYAQAATVFIAAEVALADYMRGGIAPSAATFAALLRARGALTPWLQPAAPLLPSRSALLLWTALSVAQADAAAAPVAELAQASEHLQSWLLRSPQDALVWDALASVYHAQGQPLRSLRASGEARVALLDYSAAQDRFKAALALPRNATSLSSAEHIDLSILDARSRAVQVLHKALMDDKVKN